MAIAFLTGANGGSVNAASGANFSFDSGSTGSDRYLVVGVGTSPGPVLSMTYAGVSMTFIGAANNGGQAEELWGLANPATGTNNLVITTTSAGGWEGAIAVYTGVPGGIQGTPATSTNQNSPMALTVTTITDNSWLVGYVRNGSGNNTAGANTTVRGSAYPISIVDTNAAQTPVGAYSLNITWGGGQPAGGVGIALSPTAGSVAVNSGFLSLMK